MIEEVRAAGHIRLRPQNRRYQVSRLSGTVFWLDGIAGFYAAALLLSRLLLRQEGELR